MEDIDALTQRALDDIDAMSTQTTSSQAAALDEMARLAALETERLFVLQHADLQRKRQELELEISLLEIETEISKARARKQVYEDGAAPTTSEAAQILQPREKPPPPSRTRRRLPATPTPFATEATGDVRPRADPASSTPRPQMSRSVVQSTSNSFPNVHVHPVLPDTVPTLPPPLPSQPPVLPDAIPPLSPPLPSQPHPHPHSSRYVPPLSRNRYLPSQASSMPFPVPQYPAYAEAFPSTDEIVTAINMPKPDLPIFKGDIMQFHSFISAFDSRIGCRPICDSDKLLYLMQYLEGEAKDLISGCIHMPSSGYAEARRLLFEHYGDPYRLAMAYFKCLSNWPLIKKDEPEQLRKLSAFITRCLNAMTGIQYMDALNHPETLKSVILKLPPYLRNRWPETAHVITGGGRVVSLSDIGAFIEKAAKVANDPIFGTVASKQQETQRGSSSGSQKASSFSVTVPKKGGQAKCFICDQGHYASECDELLDQTLSQRKERVRIKGLCFRCLGRGHMVKECKTERKIKCAKCGGTHPTIFHDDEWTDRKSTISCNSVSCEVSGVFYPIVPVIVKQKGSNRQMLTYCFFDNGSSGCFITQELFDDLRLCGSKRTLQLSTLNGVSKEACMVAHDLEISSLDGAESIVLPKTYTCRDIPVGREHLATRELASQVTQLKPFAKQLMPVFENVSIGILIGSNCPAALRPLEAYSPEGASLFAVRYQLGWTVQGTIGSASPILCNRISARECAVEMSPHADVLKALERDFNEIHSSYPDERGLSVEDRKFLQIMDQQLEFADGHYIAPLPFRDRKSNLNPADAASRGLESSYLMESSWPKMPNFLLDSVSKWPVLETEQVQAHASNMQDSVPMRDSVEPNPTERLIAQHSSWLKLRRAVAIYRKAQAHLLHKVKGEGVDSLSKTQSSLSFNCPSPSSREGDRALDPRSVIRKRNKAVEIQQGLFKAFERSLLAEPVH